MRFKEAYDSWHAGELTQMEAARLLGMCDRSFRRYLARYDEFDLEGLIDRRIDQISHRRAPVDEVMQVVGLYSTQYAGWNVKHFHGWYRREHQGTRSYTWVKSALQGARVVARAPKRGAPTGSVGSVRRCQGCSCTRTGAPMPGWRTRCGT